MNPILIWYLIISGIAHVILLIWTRRNYKNYKYYEDKQRENSVHIPDVFSTDRNTSGHVQSNNNVQDL